MNVSEVNQNMAIPNRLPANGSDRFNYMVSYLSDCQLQMVLEMDGQVNQQRLLQAMEASTIAEPIIGCRFIKDSVRPYWERRSDLASSGWCSLQLLGESDSAEKAIQEWLSSRIDIDADAMVKIRILRTSTKDIVCIKLNHLCSDGAGLIEYVHLLASLYSELAKDPRYVPKPNPEGRDQSRLFKEMGIPNGGTPQAPEPQGPTLPFTPGEPAKRRQAIRRIPREEWLELAQGFKQKGFTVNDVVLAAYMRALYQQMENVPAEQVKVMVTVNVRKFLPKGKADAIYNLSGVVHATMNQATGTFADKVEEVAEFMKSQRDNKDILLDAVNTFAFVENLEFHHTLKIIQDVRKQLVADGNSTPILSNFGMISMSQLSFDDVKVAGAYIVSPAYYAPGLMLGVSTYQDCITLNISFFESNTDVGLIEKLLDTMIEDIKSYRQ
ncbi:condensation domain-containing protein [Brevibacillus sp. MER 51]|uniref:condensation domain-containing protein n=1 Tax=Brevibacillus sp. MER 51 TaxID=2939560 RepID=UPI00203ACAE7|nr:condensation domain-containing protein [Brevibacillus sp. MER 51]MCM3145752.1 condensation domain-containing protein [Brevibacillus sp. MER 51]